MRLFSAFITLAFMAALAIGAEARVARPSQDGDDEQAQTERTAAAEPDVVVSLCLASGGVVVRGWDRREVRARAAQAHGVELSSSPAQSARRINVLVSNDAQGLTAVDCGGTSSVELDVPRGATLNLRVRDGSVEVADVAAVRVESLSGDVSAQRISKSVEVNCMSGDISLRDSSGPVRLRSVSGDVEASNVRTVEAADDFTASSTSGDVSLERIAHTQVSGSTVSGEVRLTGPLARAGRYELKTTSGDVTLEVPDNSSFRVNARVVASGEIITDFPLRATTVTPGPREPHQSNLVGTVGTGDAELSLTTFSGTIHLKKQ